MKLFRSTFFAGLVFFLSCSLSFAGWGDSATGGVTGITAGDGIRVDNGTSTTPDVHIDMNENTTNLEGTALNGADVILYQDSSNSDDIARGLVTDLPSKWPSMADSDGQCLSTAPNPAVPGKPVCADNDNWNPNSRPGTANYITIYDGSSYISIIDEDGNLPIKEIDIDGTIKGLNEQGADITANTNHDLKELHGVMYKFTAAATVTLDKAADTGYGACASYRIRDAAEKAVLDLDAAEKFNLDGTALAAGTAIEATGVGEYITVCATTDTDGSGTDGYDVYGNTSGWASE